jgi:hypothetical protein
MMPLGSVFALLVITGLVLAAVSALALRRAGARPGVARRLAGAREVKVGRLMGDGPLPERAVRVSGRLRCRDPLELDDGERLVAFHRDIEVRAGGTWRSIERFRETRSFELWDHDGSLAIDPAMAAEPLIVIPKVWRGDPAKLEEPHASAAARLAERAGPATEARATTRSLNVTDRLLVLARVTRGDDGTARLRPPEGGFVITNLAIDDAMRLLGGRHRRLAAASVAGLGIAIALLAIGSIGAIATALLAR